ncbi:asparaginase domain-containing protein [Arthrobacter sp.]|uniref:asparaginase n=1 Tax=Arthrobacter sp. TaxID=1667 RepID=UPI0033978E27
MPQISVLATGGTIASRQDSRGASVASQGVQDLLAGVAGGTTEVVSRDIFQLGSYLLDHAHLRHIAEEVALEVARDDVDGVVLTHGTDTMEETAYLLDLVHSSPKPVVLTGAQRPADAADTDGPSNLRDAIAVAAAAGARGTGVSIAFAGQVFAARATRKAHTVDPAPFRAMDGGPMGRVGADDVQFRFRPVRPPALPVPSAAFDSTRVDVVSLHPGADALLARAAVDAGAKGVIIAGTGVGNGNHQILEWVEEAVDAGIAVGLSTRVPEGPVVPFYGNGGGADLVGAGALPLGSLPLFHARLLLALRISHGETPAPDMLAPYI